MTLDDDSEFQQPADGPQFSITNPLVYTKQAFGTNLNGNDESILSFSVSITAFDLTRLFNIFEDLPNVHEWPIKNLIQRELDQGRADLIARDYLLADRYVKYFPPLTAVLIPTGSTYLPDNKYGESSPEELAALRQHMGVVRADAASFVNEASVLAKGIYSVEKSNTAATGLLAWDRNHIGAVIIDGQHRYKALAAAISENADMRQCRVTVNVINIAPVCARLKISPTAVARDLFVSINSTPVEVDEARLILMDDRDVLASFTQALVDDSDPTHPPAIRPELVDWRCDQGKHDSSVALSGVLTLRGVLSTAMFQNKVLSSVDDRENPGKVKAWMNVLATLINPDEAIAATLGSSETLKSRFELACQGTEYDPEEEGTQPFLFSYSAATAAIIKERFTQLYVPAFQSVYSGLSPYARYNQLAEEHGAFKRQSPVHKYLRAFKSHRERLEKADAELAKGVDAYRKAARRLTDNQILFTVMGQKAIFKTFFEVYVSTLETRSASDLKAMADSFVAEFDQLYDVFHKSDNHDEAFFNTRFKLGSSIKNTGDLGSFFWRGIMLSSAGEIDYGPTAIDLLSSVISDLLYFIEDSEKDFSFTKRERMIGRHAKILQSFDSDLEDAPAKALAAKVVKAKEAFITARVRA